MFNGSVFALIVFSFNTCSTLYIPCCSIVHPLELVDATLCLVAYHSSLIIQLRKKMGKSERRVIDNNVEKKHRTGTGYYESDILRAKGSSSSRVWTAGVRKASSYKESVASARNRKSLWMSAILWWSVSQWSVKAVWCKVTTSFPECGARRVGENPGNEVGKVKICRPSW